MSKDNDTKIKALVDEYTGAQSNYVSYCAVLRLVLEKFLDTEALSYQVVTARAKDVQSFEKKIRSGTPKVKKFDEMNDLAGCRIIFYF